MTLQVGNVVGCDADQFPAFLASIVEEIELVDLSWEVAEVDPAIFPFDHGVVP
jgi:hypothetical protein